MQELSEFEQILLDFECYGRKFLNNFSPNLSRNHFEMLAYQMGWEDIDKFNNQHGKRLRPLITLLTTVAFDNDYHQFLPAALSIELLHNFTLVHDDIQDKGEMRHGKESIWKKYGSRQAINVGDSLFSLSMLAMSELYPTISATTVQNCQEILMTTANKVIDGQILDLEFESFQEISADEYLVMIKAKTGALISACLRIAAKCLNFSLELEKECAEFGELLGVYFQIQDDYFGLWGDRDTIGKSTVSDLISRKKTLPIIFGIENKKDFYKFWEHSDISEQNADEGKELLIKEKVKEKTELVMNDAKARICKSIDKILEKSPNGGQELRKITNVIMNRNY